ncbi:hypothetical protein [Rodentibacter caecimuris]|uniref:Uncharacterized protein n=1 Tax=Rodentibacter caecimuris TaxID=1796644 RepID=A0ABX3KY54_9PAST|nr:hypothetical protein BKG89_04185 [Rodentibacter heylii]
MLLLRFKNSPADDVIKPTLEAWYRVITHKKVWDMALDKTRFETAFMTLGQPCWFPTPKQLLEALPSREYPELPPPLPKTAEELAAEQAQIACNLLLIKNSRKFGYKKSRLLRLLH